MADCTDPCFSQGQKKFCAINQNNDNGGEKGVEGGGRDWISVLGF